RRRNPTFEWVGAVAVLSGGCSWFAVTDGSAFGDSIIRKAFRRTDPPQEIGVAASNSRTPRTKARRLVCNGGYSRFAVNDGLRFANPSYELIRLTALARLRCRVDGAADSR
ncbi:hypothetical protein, partial [Stutzerimonas stutzeri]|uniref:hypothetical protein n=1 Tax=Stutzerimonas stutzeri TaxID=316 RepID=UPI00210CDD79